MLCGSHETQTSLSVALPVATFHCKAMPFPMIALYSLECAVYSLEWGHGAVSGYAHIVTLAAQ